MAWEHKSQMTAPTVNWNKCCVAEKALSYRRFLVRFDPETARCWLRAARDRFFGEWIPFLIRGHWPVAGFGRRGIHAFKVAAGDVDWTKGSGVDGERRAEGSPWEA
jgi:hypothetical protein